jgi:DNA mismatch repair ATPase MutS
LEINALTQRAAKIGVPHVIAKIAKVPMYVSKELYDVSLLAKNCESIVPNDADFTENEPFAFLLGANGGGKTTYLRALGVNLVLFLAGCPVFAREAEIYPFDIVLSHFPKDERFDNTGRLDEERGRTEKMLDAARGKRAFMFFNETYSGADEKRGFDLLTDTVEKIKESNFFGLYVTHFHEVMTLDYPVLSAEVDLDDANKRTFRIVRSKGSASSYAADILKKYCLDKDSLMARRGRNGN